MNTQSKWPTFFLVVRDHILVQKAVERVPTCLTQEEEETLPEHPLDSIAIGMRTIATKVDLAARSQFPHKFPAMARNA